MTACHKYSGVAAILVLLNVGTTAIGSDDEMVEYYVGHLIAAHHSGMVSAQVYPLLFRAAGSDGLIRLQAIIDDSIAIQSAWETVELTIPVERGDCVYRPSRDRLNWFLGFFQGRARVTPPQWWIDIVLDARANRRGNVFPGKLEQLLYHDAGVNRIRCPINAEVDETNGVVTYRQGEDAITIPEEILRRAVDATLVGHISVCFTAEHGFVAVHGDHGASHVLGCVVRGTGALKWKARVCGCLFGGATGRHESWVTVEHTDDGRVFVFGAATMGFYAHGFSSADGQSLVRFSSGFTHPMVDCSDIDDAHSTGCKKIGDEGPQRNGTGHGERGR